LLCSLERETPSWYFEYEIGTKCAEGKGATKRNRKTAHKVNCTSPDEAFMTETFNTKHRPHKNTRTILVFKIFRKTATNNHPIISNSNSK
jgi:hypothetical protein